MFCPLNKPELNQVKIQVLLDTARCLICKKNNSTVQYKSEDTVTCPTFPGHYWQAKANSGCSSPSPQREEVKLTS